MPKRQSYLKKIHLYKISIIIIGYMITKNINKDTEENDAVRIFFRYINMMEVQVCLLE